MVKGLDDSTATPISEHIQNVIKVLCSARDLSRSGTEHNLSYGRNLEATIADELRPYLPNRFGLEKTCFVRTSEAPCWESNEIDIVLTNQNWGSPLAITKEYKVYPIESVMGIMLVTGSLNSKKLKDDFEIAQAVQRLKTRRYEIPLMIAEKYGMPLEGHIIPKIDIRNQRVHVQITDLSPRFFYFSYSSDWEREKTICKNIEQALREQNDVVLHGMYILEKGFFRSVPGERTSVEYDNRAESFLTFLHVLLDSLHTFSIPPELATLPLSLYGSAPMQKPPKDLGPL